MDAVAESASCQARHQEKGIHGNGEYITDNNRGSHTLRYRPNPGFPALVPAHHHSRSDCLVSGGMGMATDALSLSVPPILPLSQDIAARHDDFDPSQENTPFKAIFATAEEEWTRLQQKVDPPGSCMI